MEFVVLKRLREIVNKIVFNCLVVCGYFVIGLLLKSFGILIFIKFLFELDFILNFC